MATFNGDGNDNTLTGLAADDTINGFGGADSLSGLDGTDLISGGTGDDVIQGGAGSDMVFGESGNDTVIHVFADNEGTTNEYDGGGDTDVLRLELTSAELIDLANDLRALDTQLSIAPGSQYSFNAVSLVVDNFESIEIVLDNVVIAASDLPDVVADVIVVEESEDSGDTDGNVLSNDNATPVVEVAGDTGNVGEEVAGSNGGLFTINADGTADFDANDDFEGLGVGETAITSVTYGAEVSGVQGKFDIILTQDLSSSFSDDLPNVRSAFDGLFDDLSAGGNDVGFGVASFVDKPIAPFGFSTAGDFAYNTDQSVSTDKATTQTTLDGLGTFNGLDSDESQLVALQQIALRATSEVGFRDGAQRFVVLQTDADPHVAGDFSAAGEDDGDTDITETEDYPTVASVGALLNAANISVIFAISPQQTTISAYQQLLADLGVAGTVVTLSSDSSNLSSAIQGALDTLTSTDTATLTATVTGENDLPTAAADTGDVTVGAPVSIDVLANDTDPDTNDVLTIASVDPAARGTASIVGGQVQYDPGADFTALGEGETDTEVLTYTITDGNGGTATASVTVMITGVNDLPVAGDDTGDVTVGAPVSIDVLANDTDPDTNDVLTIANVDPATRGTASIVAGQVQFDPGTDFAALGEGETDTETLIYTVSDGNGGTDTASVTVTITGVNDLPIAGDDVGDVTVGTPVSIDVLANDTDPDANDVLTIASLDPATRGMASIVAGQVQYDPGTDFAALGEGETDTETLTYTVSDGNGGTDTASVTVTVTGVNDLPVAGDDVGDVTVGAPVSIDVLANDTDPDTNDVLTIASVDPATRGTASIVAGQVQFDPGTDFASLGEGETDTETLTYTVSDGNGGTDTASVTVTVTGVNDAPVAVDDTGDVTVGVPASFDVLANDTDPDTNDVLTIASVDPAARGTASIVGGQVQFDPGSDFDTLNLGETAIETLTYTVSDGNGSTDTASVTVTVFGSGSTPSAVNDTASVSYLGAININVLMNDTDPDMDALSVLSVTDPANGTATINANNTINFNPDNTFVGTETFSYTVSDGNGGTDTADVTVSVTNIPPSIGEPVAFGVDEGLDLVATLNGIDPEGFPVTYAIGGGPDGGEFSVNPTTGELQFNTTPDFEMPTDADGDNVYLVDITVSDQFVSNTQRVVVTVNDVQEFINPPEITSPTPAVEFQPVRQFLTNASVGVLTDVEATDFDVPSGDTLQFSLFGEDASQFSINAATGEISLDQPLNNPFGSFDGDAIYEVVVVVEDSVGFSDTQEIDYLLFVGG